MSRSRSKTQARQPKTPLSKSELVARTRQAQRVHDDEVQDRNVAAVQEQLAATLARHGATPRQPDGANHDPVVDPYADVPPPDEPPDAPAVHDADELTAGEVRAGAYDPAAKFTPLDWHHVFAKQPDSVPWLVEDFLIRGSSYALVAAAKAGKSLLMLDVAAALAAGRSALGRRPLDPVAVVYIDIENTERDIVERLDEMGYRPDELGRLAYYSFPSLAALDTIAGGTEIVALAERHDAALVVIDTLSRVVVGDENSSDTYRALYRHAIAPLKRDGRTVVRLDHLGKDATRGSRGSSAKNDDVDCVWLLIGKGEDAAQLRRERQRSNHHPEWIDVTREADPLRHVAAAGDADPRVTKLIADLDRIGAPDEIGRKNARAMLAHAGITTSNTVLQKALPVRQARSQNPRSRVTDETTVNDSSHFLTEVTGHE